MSDFIKNNAFNPRIPGGYPSGGDSGKGKAKEQDAEQETAFSAAKPEQPLDPDRLLRAYGQNPDTVLARNELAAQSISRSMDAFMNSPMFGGQIDFWDNAFAEEFPHLDPTQRALYVSDLVLARNGFEPVLELG